MQHCFVRIKTFLRFPPDLYTLFKNTLLRYFILTLTCFCQLSFSSLYFPARKYRTQHYQILLQLYISKQVLVRLKLYCPLLLLRQCCSVITLSQELLPPAWEISLVQHQPLQSLAPHSSCCLREPPPSACTTQAGQNHTWILVEWSRNCMEVLRLSDIP